MRLNLQVLRHFVIVADSGSLGRASALLNISQTGLTKSIKRLEEHLGGQLFNRSTQGMTLTKAGNAFLPHARLLISQAMRAVDAVGDLLDGREGRLAIGAAPEWLGPFVQKAVLQLRREYPGMTFFVCSGRNTRILVEGLLQGSLDLVVGVTQLDDAQGLEFEALARNRQGIIAAIDHPLRNAGPLDFTDLATYEWVLPAVGTLFRARLEGMFREAGAPPPLPCVETDFLPFVISCVSGSDMLGTATEGSMAAHPGAPVDFLDMPTFMERPVGILWRAGEPLTLPQLRLMDTLRDQQQASR